MPATKSSAKMPPTPWQKIVRSRMTGASKAAMLMSGRTTAGAKPYAGRILNLRIERRGGRI